MPLCVHAFAPTPLLAAVVAGVTLLTPPSGAEEKAPALDLHGDPLPPGAVARIGSLRFRQPGAFSIAVAPDGRLIAVGGWSSQFPSTVALFDADTGKVVRRLPGHVNAVTTVAFSPDGKRLASVGGDRKLRVWDVARGERVCEADGVAGEALAFLAGGKTLATADAEGDIRVLDATTGQTLRRLRGHEQHVFCLAAAGTRLVSCSRDGTTRIWDAGSGQPLHRWPISVNGGRGVAFSRDARLLACGTYLPAGVDLWDLATGKLRWRLESKEGLSAWAFSADGSELYTLGEELRVLDTATGKDRRRWPMPKGLFQLQLAPDGKTAAIQNGAEVKWFDLSRGEWIVGRDGHAGRVDSLAFCPDGTAIVTASGEAVFRLWDAGTGRLRRTFAGSATVVAFAPDGRTLASAGFLEMLDLWDVATGTKTRSLETKYAGLGEVRLACTAGRPPLLALGHGDHLLFWDPATGKPHPNTFTAEVDKWAYMAFLLPFALAPDGKTVAIGRQTGTPGPILLWDLTTGKEMLRTTVRAEPWAFSPDGRLLAARSAGEVFLVEARTGREVRRINVPGEYVSDIAFSPDGKMFATASFDGTVRLWETMSGRERRCFRGHEHRVLCVAFSPDGRRLASGSADLTVLIWDVSAPAPR